MFSYCGGATLETSLEFNVKAFVSVVHILVKVAKVSLRVLAVELVVLNFFLSKFKTETRALALSLHSTQR